MGRQSGLADRTGLTRVAVRPIEEQDVQGVIALWNTCGLLRPWNDPEADIARARAAPQAEIFVVPDDGRIVATVMVGHDGHRGWLYYLAVAPERRGAGLGREVTRTAEEWLASRGVPKVELMIRTGNPVGGFYESLGYESEPRTVMARWLTEQPMREQPAELDVTITYLEMREPPARPPANAPRIREKIALLRVERPTVGFYRYLYNAVGGRWRWYERNALSDDELAAIVQDDRVEIYVLYIGGSPAGYAEIDFRQAPDVELAYFGLIEDYIGRGLGQYMLDWAIDTAWMRTPERLWVNTCTLDHPSALAVYQKAGFTPYEQKTITIADPHWTPG